MLCVAETVAVSVVETDIVEVFVGVGVAETVPVAETVGVPVDVAVKHGLQSR